MAKKINLKKINSSKPVKTKVLVRFDWFIKHLLRDKSNYVILEGFFSELIKQDVLIEEILESESNQSQADIKFNRVDVLVKNKKGEFFIIELQNDKELDFLQRMLYGTSTVITERLRLGDAYSNIKKVYAISIVYFELGQGEDYIYHGTTRFLGVHKNDELSLSKQQKEQFGKNLPYELLPEYYLIKAATYNENLINDTLDEWMYFLKTSSVRDDFKAKGIQEAKEKLDIANMDDEQRANYKSYVKDGHLAASLAETMKKDMEDIIRDEKIKTTKQVTIEIAISMLKENVPVDIVIKTTKLNIKEVEKLKKNIKNDEI